MFAVIGLLTLNKPENEEQFKSTVGRTDFTSKAKTDKDTQNNNPVASKTLKKTEDENIPTQSSSSNDNTEINAEPDYGKYLHLLPKLFVLRDTHRPNVDYALPVNEDPAHIEYYKKLMDDGDPMAKFLYATRIEIPLNGEINKEFELKGENIDIDYWRKRFEYVHQLYIESVQAGIAQAPAQLAMSPNHIYKIDRPESISWALIGDKMGGRGSHYIKIICGATGGCTNEMLLDGVDRANFYIDFLDLKQK